MDGVGVDLMGVMMVVYLVKLDGTFVFKIGLFGKECYVDVGGRKLMFMLVLYLIEEFKYG